MSMRTLLPAISAILAFGGVVPSVAAAPDAFDSTFGEGGIALAWPPLEDKYPWAKIVVVQPDGRILVGADVLRDTQDPSEPYRLFSIARLHPDGRPDESFGHGSGFVEFSFGRSDYLGSMAVQADGRILVAGHTGDGDGVERFTVMRLEADGDLDTSFAGTGRALEHFADGPSWARAVAVQTDGRILAMGRAHAWEPRQMIVVRYLPDGGPDRSFGGEGWVAVPVGSEGIATTGMRLLRDGRILLAAYRRNPESGATEWMVTRLRENGSVDESFGSDGTAAIAPPLGDASAYVVAVDSKDRILLAGQGIATEAATDGAGRSFDRCHMVIGRLRPNGGIDRSFGDKGFVLTPCGRRPTSSNWPAPMAGGILDLAEIANDKIMAVGVGWLDEDPYYTYSIGVQYLENGMLDTSYGNGDGFATSLSNGFDGGVYGMAVQGDGKVLVTAGGDSVARLEGEGAVAPERSPVDVGGQIGGILLTMLFPLAGLRYLRRRAGR